MVANANHLIKSEAQIQNNVNLSILDIVVMVLRRQRIDQTVKMLAIVAQTTIIHFFFTGICILQLHSITGIYILPANNIASIM